MTTTQARNEPSAELAARVEALTGPCRETDGLIFKASFPDRDWVEFHDTWCARCPDDDVAFDTPPAYTASLDAAMTLVPDCHRSGVLYHALRGIQETGFPDSTFLHRLICEIVAQALRARSA